MKQKNREKLGITFAVIFIFTFGTLANSVVKQETGNTKWVVSQNKVEAQKDAPEKISVEAEKQKKVFDKLEWQKRINNLLCNFGSPICNDFATIDYSIESGIKHGVHPYVYWSLAFGDTSLCKNLTTAYNCTNFGNTDGGLRTGHRDYKQNIDYTFALLAGTLKEESNGRFKGDMRWVNKLGELSFGGQARLYGKVVSKNTWATSSRIWYAHATTWSYLSQTDISWALDANIRL